MPGAERIVQECGLYDVVPVLSHHLNGATVQDFPISSLKELLVDPTDAQDILRGIRAAVERYDDILSSDIWSHFQTNILVHDPTADWRNLASGSLPHPTTHNLAAIDSWSSSASIVLSIFSHTEQQDQWLFATILSAFFYNPLLRLKVINMTTCSATYTTYTTVSVLMTYTHCFTTYTQSLHLYTYQQCIHQYPSLVMCVLVWCTECAGLVALMLTISQYIEGNQLLFPVPLILLLILVGVRSTCGLISNVIHEYD